VYRGYYLNLARNKQRLERLTQHLQAIGAAARYDWFEAVDGRAVAAAYQTPLDSGNLGLWLSHEQVLRAAPQPGSHLHILEDDAVLAKGAVQILDAVLAEADAHLEWDLLFTDILVPLSTEVVRLFAEKLQMFARSNDYTLVELDRIRFACTSSFFINKKSIDQYAGLIAGKWSLGIPIDIHLRNLVHQGHLKAYVTLPFVTTVSRDSLDSDIRGSVDRSRRVVEIFRRAFFQEADLPALLAEMRELTQGTEDSLLTSLFLCAISFSQSDQWKPF
jgi:GR25 family glycosyltransferase involved in LPS biosynthesis